MASANFYAEPVPEISYKKPGRPWHLARVLYEWQWFRRWL